jgi:hypothetical protein
MARKLLSPADIPAIEYKCLCGGDAIDYAKFRRRHKHCFDCIYMKAVSMDVVCTNPEMKSKVPKGEK